MTGNEPSSTRTGAPRGSRCRPPLQVLRGAEAIASARGAPGAVVQPALVKGAAGAAVFVRGRPLAVLGLTMRSGRIAEIDAIVGFERVQRVAAAISV
jgi:hypothetical protein